MASPAAAKSGPRQVVESTPMKSPEKKKTKIEENTEESIKTGDDQGSAPKRLDSTFQSVIGDEDIHGPSSSVPWHYLK